jgi:hypothetical protein
MQQPRERAGDCLLLFLLGVFLFASPFSAWWMGWPAAWYWPFLLWVALIGVGATLASRLMRSHGD